MLFEKLRQLSAAANALVRLSARLDAIEARLAILESNQRIQTWTVPVTTIAPVGCNGACEFPEPWFGTIPPQCKRCGKQAFPPYTITYTMS